jgi:hypothetical protein
MQQLGRRMVQAISLGMEGQPNVVKAEAEQADCGTVVELQLRTIEGAGHACAGKEDELVEVVCEFLQKLPLD